MLKNTIQKQPPAVDLNDIFLYGQKEKKAAESKKGKLYFSYEKLSISENTWQITIKLDGDDNVAADAADLQLDSENLEIVDVAPGDAFPSYPRYTKSGRSVIITGVSAIEKNNITFGMSGKTFAIIKVTVKPQEAGRSSFTVNLSGTKIYFSAQDILDRDRNFTQIEL